MSSHEMEVANDLFRAFDNLKPIAPVRNRISGANQAYAVQRILLDRWQQAGRRLVGHKIGLTSEAVRKQIGVDEPDYGAIFEDMVLPDGAIVKRSSVIQPRVEGEIAFVLGKDLEGEVTADDVIAATDYVSASIEICDSRIESWDIRLEDTLADNASSCLVVMGKRKIKPSLEALARATMIFKHDGTVVGSGSGSACLGNPANAVAWLAQTLSKHGTPLRAGELIMSGALAPMISAGPGSHFEADFGENGNVSVSFSSSEA